MQDTGMSSIQKVSMRDCRPIQGTYRVSATFRPFWGLRPERRGKHNDANDFIKFLRKALVFHLKHLLQIQFISVAFKVARLGIWGLKCELLGMLDRAEIRN